MRSVSWLMLSLAVGGIFGSSASAQDSARAYPRKELLVEPADVSLLREFVILDARSKAKYDAGHVPGAIWVDHAAWSKAFSADPKSNAWNDRIGALGLSPTSKVILYDDLMQKDAARIWWILRHFGVKDARLLNGGWPAWKAAKLSTSIETPQTTPGQFSIAIESGRHADRDAVVGVLRDKSAQIVDSRSYDEHCGDDKKAKRGGHIPGSLHLEWSDALDPSTHKFKSPDQLREIFHKAGIDLAKSTVTHCQSGGRAAVMVFTLELMGATSVSNYYRGWSEWGNAEDVPVAIPSKK